MSVSIFHLHLRSLIELKQSGTVVEYTAAFWERLHPVLDLDSDLNIKSFVDQYVKGLRGDIQAAVRSRSPSSITCASSLARIREDEIAKDAAKGADKLGVSDGLTPTGTVTDVSPEPAALVQCRAGQSASTIDVSCSSALTPSTGSMECPGSDATVDVLPKLAASAERDEDLDTVSVAALPPSTCSTGGLAHGRGEPAFSSCPATQGTWPYLQPKPPWVYSVHALFSQGPERWEHFYTNHNLNLLLSPWNVGWYLDVVFGRLEKWWPRTHFLQKATVVISEAHSKFLDTSVPAQLDDLLPPSKPPDGSEGCATMCSGEGCDQFSTREVKVISLDISSTELMLNCYSLLEPMQSWIGGQCTYAGDWLTKILERYIQPRGKINVIFSCPCPEQVYRLQDSLEVTISWRLEKWSHTQSVQPANAVFEAHYKLLDTTEVFSIEPSLEPALLSRYLVFFRYTEPKHSAWHFSLVHPVQIAYCLNTTELFSTASVTCLCILAIWSSLGHGLGYSAASQWDPITLYLNCRATIQMQIKCQNIEVSFCALLISVKYTVGSMKKTCDLVGPMDQLKDGQGIKTLEQKTLRKNADCQSVRSVSAQLKCDGIECHFDHILNPQIWALQVTIRLVKVGWQNLMLQQIVCGLSAWEPATVCLVKILAVVIKLQVPWDPGIQFVLGEFGVSACGQADSQGEANVMTVATQKLMGQVMTWAWAGTELGLAGSVREYRKEATQMRRGSTRK